MTPPIGNCLFVTAKIGRAPVLAVAASSLPWLLIMLVPILPVAFIPAISLVLV